MTEMVFYDGIDERRIAIFGYLVYHQNGSLRSILDLQMTEMRLMIFMITYGRIGQYQNTHFVPFGAWCMQ